MRQTLNNSTSDAVEVSFDVIQRGSREVFFTSDASDGYASDAILKLTASSNR